MSEAISTLMSIVLSISVFIWTCIKITNQYNLHRKSIALNWSEEYEAHECGRLLAANANIHAYARHLAHKFPDRKNDIQITEANTIHKLELTYRDHLIWSSNSCWSERNNNKISELYLLSEESQPQDSANYFYRLSNSKIPDPGL